MKELSIEEKAKAYDIALDKIKRLLGTGSNCSREELEYVFPELKESEDERIRKELLNHLKAASYGKTLVVSTLDYKRWADWLEKQEAHANFCSKIQVGDKVTRNEDGVLVNLSQLKRVAKKDEKQGEQKPTNKVEPKFKAGDWIVFNGLILHIDEIVDGYYRTTSIGGIPNSYDWAIDNAARLWTIQDAKDGDVLASKDKLNILIFRNLDTSTSFSSYYNIAGKGELGWSNECFIPATKEQRDLLFQKMKEAGYEWDAEKKELKKIEQKPAWSEDDEPQKELAETYLAVFDKKFPILPTLKGKQLADYKNFLNKCQQILGLKYCGLRPLQAKLFEKLSLLWAAWGAEHLKGLGQTDGDTDNKKQEWGEEDEDILNTIINHFEIDLECTKNDDIIRWLKSLRPQSQWKPSEEQMEALESAIADAVSSIQMKMLNSLYQELKKLKEE